MCQRRDICSDHWRMSSIVRHSVRALDVDIEDTRKQCDETELISRPE